jgi:hypothetical protein
MTRILLTLFTVILYVRCANIVPPTGGPRDLDGPKVLSSYPRNGTTNYKQNYITITCDELIDDNQLSSKVVVSPIIEGIYSVKVKNNTLKLSWKDTLKPNTTYTFNFSEGVKDIREASTLKNYSVTFSTGSDIDSSHLKSKIKPLPGENTNPNSKILLFEETKDSITSLLNRKPEYVGTLDSGMIKINYIKENTYTVLAIIDNNKNNKWDKNEPVDIKTFEIKNTVNEEFSPQKTILDTTKLLSANSMGKFVNLLFSKGLQKIIIKDEHGTYTLNKQSSTKYAIENEYKLTDTSKIQIDYVDSMGISGVFYKKIKFKDIDLQKDKDSLINIININSSKFIRPHIDSIQFITDKLITKLDIDIVVPKHITYSIINNYNNFKIILKGQREKDSVLINIPYKACSSIYNEYNRAYKQKFVTGQEKDYGNLNFEIKTQAEEYIIYLENKKNTIVYTSKNTRKNSVKNMEPGEYKLFVHIDTNKDGYWNAYDPVKNIPAEPIIYFKENLTIRANWDLEDIQMIF